MDLSNIVIISSDPIYCFWACWIWREHTEYRICLYIYGRYFWLLGFCIRSANSRKNSMLLGKTLCNHCDHCNHYLFSYYLAYFDTILLYLYTSSSVTRKSNQCNRLDIVGVRVGPDDLPNDTRRVSRRYFCWLNRREGVSYGDSSLRHGDKVD